MRYLHTMVRVANVDEALDFYCHKLGLREVRRVDSQQGRFTLIFLAAPEEVASSVLYLCSDQARYITGVTLPVDGGASVQRG